MLDSPNDNNGLVSNLVEKFGDPLQDEPGKVLAARLKPNSKRINHEEIIQRKEPSCQ